MDSSTQARFDIIHGHGRRQINLSSHTTSSSTAPNYSFTTGSEAQKYSFSANSCTQKSATSTVSKEPSKIFDVPSSSSLKTNDFHKIMRIQSQSSTLQMETGYVAEDEHVDYCTNCCIMAYPDVTTTKSSSRDSVTDEELKSRAIAQTVTDLSVSSL